MAEKKEQLEKELILLNESLNSGIITGDEYKKRKDSIEKSLVDINKEEFKKAEEKTAKPARKSAARRKTKKAKKEEPKIGDEKLVAAQEEWRKEETAVINPEIKEEKADGKEPEERSKEKAETIREDSAYETKKEADIAEKKGPEIDLVAENGSKEKLEVYEETKSESDEEKEKEPEETKEKATEPKEEETEKDIEELHEEKKPYKKSKKKFIAVSAAILLFLFLLYFYAFREVNSEKQETELKPACISDDDCFMEGKISSCAKPNTTEAECEFRDDKTVYLTVINDNNCASCDTSRMLTVIKKLFPMVEEKDAESGSDEGKGLISALGIEALPSYIFEDGIQEAFNFENFKRALIKKGDKYIINAASSGSNYYFKRNETKNKIDIFVLPSTPANVEDNVKEVLSLFKNKISYSKHVVSAEEEKSLGSELGMTTFPSFLVNNRLKFTGIQPSELIKNRFCELNNLPECQLKLSESLK